MVGWGWLEGSAGRIQRGSGNCGWGSWTCVPAHVCVYFKKVKWGTSATLTIGGRERHGSVVTRPYTQRPPTPPPQWFFYSQPVYHFFLKNWHYTRKQSLSSWNSDLQNWYRWVHSALLGSPLPPHNKAKLSCWSCHYKQLNHVILLTLRPHPHYCIFVLKRALCYICICPD